MIMTPQIVDLEAKTLIGQKLTMSLTKNLTGKLWAGFMPRRKEIRHAVNSDLISLQVYDGVLQLDPFDPSKVFTKWAAVEVNQVDEVPEGMEQFTIPAGRYAVFHYKGSSTDPSIFGYIFGTWLPASGYQLDDRPHFEVLGEKYKNNDPSSEEDIWIPIK